MTLLRTIVRPAADPAALAEAVSWLKQGQPVAFPTDTVYGVGVAMDDVAGLERLYRVKERPPKMGIPLLLADVDDLRRVCPAVPEAAWRLAQRFWPGGLTIVLERREEISTWVTGEHAGVAVRLPAHPVPRELARRLGRPLAASSANRSGNPAPVTAAEVLAQLGGRLPLILDGGPCMAGQASTIVDLTVEPPLLRRAGPIPRAQLEAVLGRVREVEQP